MNILAVDSCSKTASVAAFVGENLICEFYLNSGLTHSQTLVPMIDWVLKACSLKLSAFDAFAVTSGPGSFTGVRIGISAVKGMALALNKLCVGLSTLESMTYNFSNLSSGNIVCACMDARRNQLYNAIFEYQSDFKRLTEDRIILLDDLTEELKIHKNSKIFFVGDGAELCYNHIKKFDEFDRICLAPEHIRYIRASSAGRLALEKINQNKNVLVPPGELNPIYLRKSQAERELKSKQHT